MGPRDRRHRARYASRSLGGAAADRRGLFGIAFAPFLHVSFGHLIANTIPFVVLARRSPRRFRQFLEVTVIVMLVSGLGIWLFGTAGTVHLGRQAWSLGT